MAERDQEDADADPDGLDNEHEGSYAEDGVRRPMNAFFIFCKRHRDVVREKYPHLENRSITKILGEWWANLDSSEKSSYTDLAKEYRNVFMKAHPDFKWYKAPSAPTRTLVTRPSNSRCLQAKKEKSNSKSPPCGIALGKLADEKELGGLSSLISQNSSECISPTADLKCHDASLSPVPSPSSCAPLLKPPKKRYLVNGEFKCEPKEPKVENRDYQTQNACSALMELAEICANTAPHTQTTAVPAVSTSISEGHGLYKSIFSFPKLTNFKSYPGLDASATSSVQGSSYLNRAPSSNSASYIESPLCSREYLPRHSASSVPDYQEQPLNLCKEKQKEKEKTFRTSNQQIINHLVDKFLCDSPSAQSTSSSSGVVESPATSSSSPSFPKSSQLRQGFTLSAAIESAIDQAYSRTPPSATLSPSSASKKETTETEEPETGFIDKIKKACLASSRMKSEKRRTNNRYSLPLELQDESSKPLAVKEDVPEDTKSTPESKTDSINSDSAGESSSSATSLKREVKFSSSKYYSKYVSPPKKSRVWCNLFMKEQLSNCDLDSIDDKNSLLYDLASPVRRNSTRTCKGRRYQALITEGLLQSTKERKTATGRKTTPPNEKCRTKTSPVPESPPPLPKSKRKKKDHVWKAKAAEVGDSSAAKNEFDLNEKIASLPKCSLETLNKKKRTATSSESSNDSKSSSNSSSKTAAIKKTVVKETAAAPSIETENVSEKSNEDNSSSNASSGRFKTGGFDLEQHIASLPKCDIEVLNKRRNKKE